MSLSKFNVITTSYLASAVKRNAVNPVRKCSQHSVQLNQNGDILCQVFLAIDRKHLRGGFVVKVFSTYTNDMKGIV